MKPLYFANVIGTLLASLSFYSNIAYAVDSSWLPGECRPIQSTKQYTFNFLKTVTDIKENINDTKYDNAFSWTGNSEYYIQCNCTPDFISNGGPVYFKGESPLPIYKVDGEKTYYKITDNLAVAMRSYIWKQGTINVPFEMPNGGSGQTVCTNNLTQSGSQGELDLMIIKPILGVMNIPQTTIFNIYGTVLKGSFGTTPLAQVSINGSVTVTQSCEVNAGQAIQVDFGDMFNGNFKGQGSKPEGVATKSLQLGYKCNLVSPGMNVSMKFTGQNDSQYPSAFATTNQDIGVVIEDGNGNRLQPNTGSLPMTIDYNNQTGSVNITTYPVSTTGNIPVVGQFTSRATVVVDFQ
ncbi:fimbrial protein [Enterobacter mori]|uniref:fimbrial protein n=1 Tax=Enterobacter mori TaxID=539813 RepID=UPI002B2066FF|nr:fimbrial protein [Enterobacter mori]MEA5204760.1 fimbrial protein [Enterobacter mori]